MEINKFEHGTDTALTDQNGIRQELKQLRLEVGRRQPCDPPRKWTTLTLRSRPTIGIAMNLKRATPPRADLLRTGVGCG